MNLDELNVFDGDSNFDSPDNVEKNSMNDLEDECPVFAFLEDMYFEPKPYGTTLKISNVEKLLKGIGYNIVQEGDGRYALKDGETVATDDDGKADQSIISVYKSVVEELAVAKFIKDWKDVFGSK